MSDRRRIRRSAAILLAFLAGCTAAERGAPALTPPAPEASTPTLRPGLFADEEGIAILSARFSPILAKSPDPGPLAFRVVDGAPVPAATCELLGEAPKARFYRAPERLSPEQLLAQASKGVGTRHVVSPIIAPQADVLLLRHMSWTLTGPVLRRGDCKGVTHASSTIELGKRVDSAAGDECGDLGSLEHLADGAEGNCPMEVIAFELQPITLADVGAESEPRVEPMIHIEGGAFGDQAIEAFWMHRDEVGHEAFARCVRAGACSDGQEPRRVSPFSDGPAAVQLEDAAPYCRWVGKRLPTLQEWQWAAGGRGERRLHPWGDAAPDFGRVCAVDGKHERGVDRASFESRDPRIAVWRSEGAWVGVWRRVADARGVRPLGESRDGLRDLIGNMREVVRAHGGEGANLLTVGGSFRNYLPDHSEIVLIEGDNDDDEGLREFHERARTALTVDGATIEGFEMRGDYGRLGIRCAADTPPEDAALRPVVRTIDGRQVSLPRGLRRFSEVATLCRDFRVASKGELDALVSRTEIPDVPYWAAGQVLWSPGETPRKPDSTRSTARVVCVEIGT